MPEFYIPKQVALTNDELEILVDWTNILDLIIGLDAEEQALREKLRAIWYGEIK